MMKLLNILLAFTVLLINDPVVAQSAKTGKFDEITTNSPSKTTIDLKKNVDMQSTGGAYIPSGTTAQRPSPTKDGMIRFNSDTGSAEIYKSGAWGAIGGGVSPWLTAKVYALDDLVVESNKFYKCIVAHTSGTFATDLAANKWVEVSATDLASATGVLPIANGGTGSSTQNFVDLSTTQASIAGNKTFTATLTAPQLVSNVATGTAPLVVTSTTPVANLSIEGNAGTVTNGVYTTNKLSALSSTTSAELSGVISDETGTNKLVYSDSPTLVTPNIGAATGTSLTTSGTLASSNLSGTNTGDLLTKSDKDGSDVTTNKLTAPYGQLSTSATGIRNIDTGNTNILSNSAFRVGGGTVSSVPNWTLTTADADDDGTFLTITPTSSGGGLKQTVTTNAAQLMGVQGAVIANVKTTGSDVYVCPLMNGSRPSDITKYCGKVPVTTTAVPFPQVIVPFIMDGTSNGIEIYSTGTSPFQFRKTVSVFAGQSAPFQGVNGARLVGTLKYAAATNCQWSSSSGSFTDFSQDTDCSTPTVTGSLSARLTKIPGFTINNAPAGVYRILANGLISRQVNNGECSYRFNDGTNSSQTGIIGGVATGNFAPMFEGQIELSTNQSTWNVSLQSLSIGATNGCYIETDTAGEDLTFSVYYFPPESKIYSQASQDTSWTPCTFSTLAWQGLGTVTNNLLCARKGADLKIKGSIVTGTVTASTVQIPIPSNYGTATTGTTAANESYGFLQRAVAGAGNFANIIGVSGLSYFQVSYAIGAGTSTSNPTTAISGTGLTNTGETLIINATIPIQGWQDYGVIVGSFAGIEKCANDYECTDTFSAYISTTGVVSNENLDWLGGNCTVPSGTHRSCTFKTNLKDGTNALTSAMNCTASAKTGTGYTSSAIVSVTNTGFIFNSGYGSTGEVQDIIVTCQKGTNDYKPKTAKVASSIGVPTVPGVTTQAIDTFSFSYGTTNATTVCSASPCSYLNQIGDAVSSVTRSSTGTYTMNTTKTYNQLKCVGGAGAIGHMNTLRCESCNSIQILTGNASNSALADSFGTIYCQGSY